MPIDFASVIDLKQSGTSQLVGASSILQPNTPSFSAWRSITGVFNAGSYFVYDAVLYNIGNGYNAGNGLFTAPVGGVYYFFAHCITDRDPSGEFRHAIYKNGGSYGGTYIEQGAAGGHLSRCAGAFVQMAAGDYVGFMMIQGAGNWSGGSYHAFGGRLV